MNALLKFIVIIVVLVIGAGYFFLDRVGEIVTQVVPPDPFKLDDRYKVEIQPRGPRLGDTMTITNRSSIDLRLHMFNAADAVKAIARENWVLKKSESRTYPRASYVFHVFKSQFLDRPLLWTQELYTDVEFTGNENNLKVHGGPRPQASVTLTNTVAEQIKFCAYNPGDAVQAIPLKCWTIGKDRTIDWPDPPRKFLLKAFKPALLDKALVTESDVDDMTAITLKKGG